MLPASSKTLSDKVIRKGRKIKLGVVAACEWLGNSRERMSQAIKTYAFEPRAAADRFPRPVDFGARRVEVPAAADIKLASIWLWLRVFELALGPCPGFGTALRLMLVTPFCGDAV